MIAEGEQEYMRRLAEAYDTPEKQKFMSLSALDAIKQSLNGPARL